MKAVIPAAGMGTRLLPLTKSVPKEMLPIVNKPAIHYVIDEVVNNNIKDILIITGRHKRAIEDYFDADPVLEMFLEKKRKYRELGMMRDISNLADITYIRQKEPLGLGHAILMAERFIGDEYFAVLLGDDIFLDAPDVLSQLVHTHKQTRSSVIAVKEVPKEEVSKYGIVSVQPEIKGMRIIDAVEKPSPESAPSNLAIMGRYILSPRIFSYLKKAKPDYRGEIQLTGAIREMALSGEPVYATPIKNERLDVGSIENWLKANIVVGKRLGLI